VKDWLKAVTSPPIQGRPFGPTMSWLVDGLYGYFTMPVRSVHYLSTFGEFATPYSPGVTALPSLGEAVAKLTGTMEVINIETPGTVFLLVGESTSLTGAPTVSVRFKTSPGGVFTAPMAVPHISEQLKSAFDDLDGLLRTSNANERQFRPTNHAYIQAKSWIAQANSILGRRFIRPSLTPDGEGGIDIEWVFGTREIMIGCRALDSQPDQIYYQAGEEYGAVRLSTATLKKQLDWLLCG
jgi:hypothetical protein